MNFVAQVWLRYTEQEKKLHVNQSNAVKRDEFQICIVLLSCCDKQLLILYDVETKQILNDLETWSSCFEKTIVRENPKAICFLANN